MKYTTGGLQIRILAPIEVDPRPWEILRRLGLRRPRRESRVPKGKMLVSHRHQAVFVNACDWNAAIKRRHGRLVSVDTAISDLPLISRPRETLTEFCDRVGIPRPARL